MDWKNGEQESILVAKAQVAPLDKVVELVERYQKAMLDSRSMGGFLSPYGSSANFEKAVLSRNDNYLNLLLSKCVSDWDVSRALWNISEKSSELTDDYNCAVRNSILSGSSVWSAIKERRRSGQPDNAGKVSIVELINQDQWGDDIYAILRNPNIKPALGEILLRKGSFSGIHEHRITAILKTIAYNPGLNEDKTDRDGPDTDHWALQDALTTLIKNAPINKSWFYALERIIEAIERKAFYELGDSSKEFVSRWLTFKPVGEFGSDESDADKKESDGFYTTLKAGQEFLSIFAAKFGESLIVDMDLNVEKALALPNSYERAAFFGTKVLNYQEVVELVDGGHNRRLIAEKNGYLHSDSALYSNSFNERFWLIFNLSVMLNAESRALIKPRLSSFQMAWFERRCEFLEKIYPDKFNVDESAKTEGVISKDIEYTSETFTNLTNLSIQHERYLSSIDKHLNFLIVIVTIILLITIFK